LASLPQLDPARAAGTRAAGHGRDDESLHKVGGTGGAQNPRLAGAPLRVRRVERDEVSPRGQVGGERAALDFDGGREVGQRRAGGEQERDGTTTGQGKMREREKTFAGLGDEEEIPGARVKRKAAPAQADEVEPVARLKRGEGVGRVEAEGQFAARPWIRKKRGAKKRPGRDVRQGKVKLSRRATGGGLFPGAPDAHLSEGARCRDFADRELELAHAAMVS